MNGRPSAFEASLKSRVERALEQESYTIVMLRNSAVRGDERNKTPNGKLNHSEPLDT